MQERDDHGVQVIRQEISDKELAEVEDGLFLKNYTLTRIRHPKSLLDKPIRPTDIKQLKIGNCYFLSALGSILEEDPTYIDHFMRVNKDGKVEVMFHDVNNMNKKYIYVLEPTIVKSENMNNHTHQAIFLLEKAYAIHRRNTEREEISKRDADIVTVLKKNNFDIEKTYEELEAAGNRRSREMLKTITEKYKLNYNASLDGGSTSFAYQALLGTRTGLIERQEHEREPFKYFLGEFLTDIMEARRNRFSLEEKTKQTLEEIFGSIDAAEVQDIMSKINGLVLHQAKEKFEEVQDAKENKKSKTEILKEFFSGIDGLSDSTRQKMNEYFDVHIPKKRGTGVYTPKQEEIYYLIKEKLLQGNLVSVGTAANVGRNSSKSELYANEPFSKGLAGSHAYQVLSCYEKEGRKFLLVRNPWGQNVRDYHKKNKTIDDREVEVLSPVEKPQLDA